jgi:hypothetical protein
MQKSSELSRVIQLGIFRALSPDTYTLDKDYAAIKASLPLLMTPDLVGVRNFIRIERDRALKEADVRTYLLNDLLTLANGIECEKVVNRP